MIKINFMYLIIQCKIFHVINFRFLRKNENILTTEKDGSMVSVFNLKFCEHMMLIPLICILCAFCKHNARTTFPSSMGLGQACPNKKKISYYMK